jgi:hypothetical protein
MFGVGTPEILVLLAAVIALLLFAVISAAWIQVDERRVVRADVERLEAPVRRLLASVAGAELLEAGSGSFVLLVKRRPVWMLIAILLTLPFGLLFLLVKDVGPLMVTLTVVEGGTEVRLVGRTSRRVLRLIDQALTPMPSPGSREVSVH